MKANEAPEKIYIQSFNISEEDAKFARKLYFDDVWTEEPESGQENIEYIRKDAFIEKAVKWINEHTSLSEKLVIEQDDRLNNNINTLTIIDAINDAIMNEVVRQVRIKRLEDYTTLELQQELELRKSK